MRYRAYKPRTRSTLLITRCIMAKFHYFKQVVNLSATCFHVELEQFWHAFASRGFVSDSWAFLFLYTIRLKRLMLTQKPLSYNTHTRCNSKKLAIRPMTHDDETVRPSITTTHSTGPRVRLSSRILSVGLVEMLSCLIVVLSTAGGERTSFQNPYSIVSATSISNIDMLVWVNTVQGPLERN